MKSIFSCALFLALIFLSGCSLRQTKEPTGFYYRIRPGDTIESIARACDISQWELRRDNKGLQSFRTGELIFIPRHNSNLKELLATRRDYFVPKFDLPEYRQPEPTPPPYREPKITNPSIVKVGSQDVYTRRFWGAGPVKTNNITAMSHITKITVHHTTVLPVYKNKSNADIVKHIYNYHRQKGWADIGYHYLIGTDGSIYQGRSEKFQGAHAGASNNKFNLGIALIGDFNQQQPTRLQLAALETMITDKVRKHNINPKNIYGHRDLKATECPGTYLYNELKHIKSRLANPLLSYSIPTYRR